MSDGKPVPKPVPNLVHFGFGKGNGFIGADLGSLFLGGEERYAEEETREITITDENRSEIAAVTQYELIEENGAD